MGQATPPYPVHHNIACGIVIQSQILLISLGFLRCHKWRDAKYWKSKIKNNIGNGQSQLMLQVILQVQLLRMINFSQNLINKTV